MANDNTNGGNKIALTKSEIRNEMKDMDRSLRNEIHKLREDVIKIQVEMETLRKFMTFLVGAGTLIVIIVDIAVKMPVA